MRHPVILRSALPALLAIVLAGCNLLGSETDEIPNFVLVIATDASTYAPDAQPEIMITNISERSIFYNTCMPTSLEALDGDNLEGILYYPVCECLCIAELEPGESWSMQVPLGWKDDYQTDFPGLRDDLSYRFRLEFYEDRQLQTPFPADLVVTNTFRVRL